MLKSFVPDLFPPLLVVNWAAQGGGHDMPLPASDGAARRAISLNKIPGYAYIGEVRIPKPSSLIKIPGYAYIGEVSDIPNPRP